jgi:hypothetical protein
MTSDFTNPEDSPSRPIRITTSGLGDETITDQTKLMRYMKLSSFLLLVSKNRLFLPTVKNLQRLDSREANLQLFWLQDYWRIMWPIVEPSKPWLLSEVLGPDRPQAWENPSEEKKKELIRTWAQALSERRSVWCWNRSVDESFALWKIYGERGVAIYSTVGQIRAALENAGVEAGLVSPVTYIGELELELDAPTHHNRVRETLQTGENPRRPYLFKDFGFHFEKEVRFVLRTNPRATFESGGNVFPIRARDFINQFKLSDDIPLAEQVSIRDLANEKLREEVNFSRPFLSPFSAASEPHGVFPDLASD